MARRVRQAQRPGLEDEFAAELDKPILRIAAYPMVWPPFSDRTRRDPMDRFPYSVVYRLSDETARGPVAAGSGNKQARASVYLGAITSFAPEPGPTPCTPLAAQPH